MTSNESGADSKRVKDLEDKLLCCICLVSPKSVLIEKCKHVAFCSECAESHGKRQMEEFGAKECPICRKEYNKTIEIKI
jgi:hypothetical protein